MEIAPGVVSEDLLHRVAMTLDEDSDLIFDWNISDADDENQLDNLVETADEFERVFDVSLEAIHERIEEKRDELRACMDEDPDDWHDREHQKAPAAEDGDIIAMFGGMFE